MTSLRIYPYNVLFSHKILHGKKFEDHHWIEAQIVHSLCTTTSKYDVVCLQELPSKTTVLQFQQSIRQRLSDQGWTVSPNTDCGEACLETNGMLAISPALPILPWHVPLP